MIGDVFVLLLKADESVCLIVGSDYSFDVACGQSKVMGLLLDSTRHGWVAWQPELIAVILDNACDSTRCAASHFQERPRSACPLCSTENIRLFSSCTEPIEPGRHRKGIEYLVYL